MTMAPKQRVRVLRKRVKLADRELRRAMRARAPADVQIPLELAYENLRDQLLDFYDAHPRFEPCQF